MEWNVKNAINRDVERQHLNKILKEIQSTIQKVESSVAAIKPDSNTKDVVGEMVTGNTETGIDVTYDSAKKVLDFAIHSFTIRLTGAVEGEATVENLNSVTIDTTGVEGIPDAPTDNNAYWRRNAEWEAVPDNIISFANLEGSGIVIRNSEAEDSEDPWMVREIQGTTDEIDVVDGDGIAGDPVISLADLANTGVGTSPVKIYTRDAKGRIEGDQNASTTDLPEGTNQYFTAARVRATVLTGLSLVTATAITAADTVLSAFGKLQAQITALASSVSGLIVQTITNGDTTHAPSGDVVFDTFATKQPLDQTLTALAAANWAANALPIGTGADTLSQTAFAANTFPARASTGNLVAKPITDFGLSLVDDANAAAAVATLGLPANISNGTYTPTATGVTNLTLPITFLCTWVRVGDSVIVSGRVDATPTAAATFSQIRFTLPVPSNFTAGGDASGVASWNQSTTSIGSGFLSADAANDQIIINLIPTAAGINTGIRFNVTYPVLP